MSFRRVLSIIAVLGWASLALPVQAQGWGMVETEEVGAAGAFVCAAPGEDGGEPPCLRLQCGAAAPLHYELALFGGDAADLPEALMAELRVDGRPVGRLRLRPETADEDAATLTARFDPRIHTDMVAALRRGNRADLVLGEGEAPRAVALSLSGSSRTLGAVMDTCPIPEVPLDDPAAVVLDQILRECGQLGGTVEVEPGFERREDLDGDGRDDVVIDYAAAVCSEMASLYCGSGGCTVGFFLAREAAFKRAYVGVIRGYSRQPGGTLALDLHGTACGLYGFEACRKVFRIADDSFALVEELSGVAAEAAMAADEARATEPREGQGEAGAAGIAWSGDGAAPLVPVAQEEGQPETAPQAADGE
ncbi:hypothetical protein [Sinisalibacter aestuarii]|uniref:Uncharacterized protein n=1 Tax=Sinisalibacter aestuarii TaxID=2949426 RepID=A0ABQ5LTD1_9RHOB|nr:hypothetical protein [Sinisalibacter aestuarii]GKY88179.1 hypothetical protein STA1M1_20480 [Sinisalibacter aestuarii]